MGDGGRPTRAMRQPERPTGGCIRDGFHTRRQEETSSTTAALAEAGASVTASARGAAVRAGAFVHAIVWAEHTTLWDLLSDRGRAAALSVAMSNGLDRVVAGRIRDDLADPVERERFLQQLVGGLRRDLRSVELTELTVGESCAADDGSVAVELLSPSQLPGTDAWPAGRLVLSCDTDRGWVVDRLEPRLAGP